MICGHSVLVLDSVYKIRYEESQRRRWDAAAVLHGKPLAEWIRDSLDRAATQELDAA